MKKTILSFFHFLTPLIISLVANPAFAQDTLNLSEAIELGLYNNFDIRIARLETDIASNNNTWGEAGRYPIVTFNLSDRFTLQEQNNPASFVNGQFRSNNLNPNIDVGWIIFEGFKVQANKERLAQLQEQSFGNANVVIETNVQAIMLAYYQILLAEVTLRTLEETYQLSKTTFEYSEEKRKLGVGTTFDLLQDKTAFLTDSSNYLKQEVNVKNAYRNLNLLMGREPETNYKIPLDSIDISEDEYTFEDLYKKMIASNQNLKNQAINLKLLEADVRLAKSPMYPTINLNLGGNLNFNNFNRDGQSINSSNWDTYASFTLNFTLYNGGKIRRQIENSETRVEIGNLQLEDAQLDLENQLRAQYDLHQVNKELIEVEKVNLETANLQLKLATERRKNGTINSIDYRNIQINQRNVSLSLYQATYNLLQSEIELIRLIGGLIL